MLRHAPALVKMPAVTKKSEMRLALMRVLLSLTMFICIACAACGASRAPIRSSDPSTSRVQIHLYADSSFGAVLIDARGRRDSLPGAIRQIPHLHGRAGYLPYTSGPDVPRYHYSVIYELYPIPDGPFTVMAYAPTSATHVTLSLDKALPMPHCAESDTLTVYPARPATWTIDWDRRSRRDTCWITFARH